MNARDVRNNREMIDHILDGNDVWIIAVERREDEVACWPTVYGMQGDRVAMEPLRDPDDLSGQMHLMDFLEVFGDFVTNIQYTERFLSRNDRRRRIRDGVHLVTITDGSAATTPRADHLKVLRFDVEALEDTLDDLGL